MKYGEEACLVQMTTDYDMRLLLPHLLVSQSTKAVSPVLLI